jgi:prepilin-type processing-associated H-X9-DG protein
LPFLEQNNIYQGQNWQAAVDTFACPARGRPMVMAPVDDIYGQYVGGGWAWAKTDYAANGLAIPNRPGCLPISRFVDGTSHTILAGEKSIDPLNYEKPTWYWDEPYFTGGSGGTQRFGTTVQLDTPGVFFADRWGSPHPSGAQFVFADGSVRPIHYTTAPSVVRALMTPFGGEIANDP